VPHECIICVVEKVMGGSTSADTVSRLGNSPPQSGFLLIVWRMAATSAAPCRSSRQSGASSSVFGFERRGQHLFVIEHGLDVGKRLSQSAL
jgi:hypothetical protein